MSVASKNLYELLGNDDEDSDAPRAPVKTVEKTSTHTVKRNADGVAPAARTPASTGPRRGGAQAGNDAAYRDRNAGSDRNRTRPTEDYRGGAGGARGGQGARVRGGRGSSFRRDRDDRHAKNQPGGGSDKQAAQSWGAPEGQSELKDEQAGEEIATTEKKDIEGEAAEPEAKDDEPVEPEQLSYDAYMAQLAEKKLALESDSVSVRKPNEGSKADKKWASAKPLVKEDGEYFSAAAAGKAKRERERKTKQVLEIDQRFVEPDRPRGGRGGGGRGGSSSRGDRGGPRGGGGDRGGRGDGPRGDGPRGGGARGDYRGGGRGRGGGDRQGLNPNDQTAFPSLGS